MPGNELEALKKTALLRKRRIKEAEFSDYVSAVVRLFTPQLLPKLMESMIRAVEEGDQKVIRLVAEMYKLVPGSGVSIVNTMIQNQASYVSPYDRTFDAIVARLDNPERVLDVEEAE